MSIRKFYTIADTKAAINRADNSNINKLKLVRNDVTNQQFGQKNIRTAHRNQAIPEAFQYPGAKDVGHVFRHVSGTSVAGKSIYRNKQTAVLVTFEMLNSSEGQQALQELDDELSGKALYDNTTKRVRVNVSAGSYYGSNDDGVTFKKIIIAQCELLSLGETLWVHSSYPREFQA